MSAPARSLAAWSVYALSVGLLLLVVPNFLLGLFQIEETSESWVRVLGSTVILLAIYYVYIVRENSVSWLSASDATAPRERPGQISPSNRLQVAHNWLGGRLPSTTPASAYVL